MLWGSKIAPGAAYKHFIKVASPHFNKTLTKPQRNHIKNLYTSFLHQNKTTFLPLKRLKVLVF